MKTALEIIRLVLDFILRRQRQVDELQQDVQADIQKAQTDATEGNEAGVQAAINDWRTSGLAHRRDDDGAVTMTAGCEALSIKRKRADVVAVPGDNVPHKIESGQKSEYDGWVLPTPLFNEVMPCIRDRLQNPPDEGWETRAD